MAEQPTIEEPAKEPAAEGTPSVQPEIDREALLKELKAMGIDRPEQIQGMHTASQQSGRLAEMVGQLRNEVAQLKSTRPQTPRSEEGYNYDETVDLGKLIRGELATFWNEKQAEQTEYYQKNLADLAEVQNDEAYSTLAPIFDEHMKSPNVQMQLQNGQTTYSKEYNKVYKRYTTKLLKQSAGLIEQLQGQGKAQPPHMESGTPSVPAPQEADERKEKINKIVEKSTGSDDDLDKLLDVMLPKDDPIMQL